MDLLLPHGGYIMSFHHKQSEVHETLSKSTVYVRAIRSPRASVLHREDSRLSGFRSLRDNSSIRNVVSGVKSAVLQKRWEMI